MVALIKEDCNFLAYFNMVPLLSSLPESQGDLSSIFTLRTWETSRKQNSQEHVCLPTPMAGFPGTFDSQTVHTETSITVVIFLPSHWFPRGCSAWVSALVSCNSVYSPASLSCDLISLMNLRKVVNFSGC